MTIPASSPPRPLTFALLKLLADGEFHSGQAMALQLGMSRASVHNALQAAPEFGIRLNSVRGRGYQLARPLYWLDAAQLTDADAALTIDILDQATSSNALLLQRAALGAASGSVLAVEWQSAGRGRLGRSWHAALGDALTFSVLWRFDCGLSGLSGLSLAVGVALLRALHELGVRDAGLKWPNDILRPNGKLAGILLEAQGDMLGPSAVVIGIGLNLAPPPQPTQIDQRVSDLLDGGVPLSARNCVLAVVLRHLAAVLREFAAHGFVTMRDEWERGHLQQDKPVTLLMPDGAQVHGVARGVTNEGALRLDVAGVVREFHAGEISLRGR